MGIMDCAKDALGKLDDAKDLAEEHADKLPGDLGDKVTDAAEKAAELKDKIPGQD